MPHQHTPKSWFFTHFPRKHLVMLLSMIVAMILAILLLPGQNAEAKRTAIPLNLELTPQTRPPVASEPIEEEPLDDLDGLTGLSWQEAEVRPGDSLSHIFQRMGLGPRDVHEIVTRSGQAKALGNLRPGQVISFKIDENNKLQALRVKIDALNSLLYERGIDGFDTRREAREPDTEQKVASATVRSSLYRAAEDANMPINLIMELANIFSGVLDFVYDVREGDYFIVVYEDLYIDGERLRSGAILAAEYVNRGRSYQAFRYTDSEGETGYYAMDGESMRKAFLRAPLEFSRISSNFDPKRLHPIFRTVRPHRGIDYAAPTGTPVYAAGDGRVVTSAYSEANGNFIVIQHGPQYETKYLHLHRRAVRRGDRVSQRQIIGWVGSTGYATGPHLHYEFLVNGVHRNPRTIVDQLPKAKSIPKQEMAAFQDAIRGIRLQLNAYAVQHGFREPVSDESGSS